jgi:uncharacterized delta-60 repeat protein/uncharacterized repeat protein (TIGR01451 family)
MRKFILSFIKILLCYVAISQPGAIDHNFNPVDKGFGYGDGFMQEVFSTAIQDDGKIIVGGIFRSFDRIEINRIARLTSNGTLDTTFNVGSGFNDWVTSTVIQKDGKILVGGQFTSYNGTTLNSIARLNLNGSLDTSFKIGSGVNGIIHSILVLNDGKIILGGDFTHFNGSSRNRIACLNTDGSLDTLFNPNAGFNSTVYSILQNEEKIIVGGNFSSVNGVAISRIARLNLDGTLDDTFISGVVSSGTVRTTLIQSDEKIILGGSFTINNIWVSRYLIRLNTNGSLDTTFINESEFNNEIYCLSIQNDGKIIVGGDFTSFNGSTANYIARLNPDGSLDSSFNLGYNFNRSIRSTTIQNDGKIIIGGDFDISSGARNRIARLNSNGTLDIDFNLGSGFNSSVRSITVQKDNKIIVGGSFTSFNGTLVNNIARLNADGSIDNSFNSGSGFKGLLSSVNTLALQKDGKIIVSGTFDTYNGTAVNNLVRLNSDGSLDYSFNESSISSVLIQNDGKIIVAYNGGFGKSYITRLNADGTKDSNFFQSSFSGNINCTAIQKDGKIILGGEFNSIDAAKPVVRLNTNGNIDGSFNVSGFFGYSTIETLVIQEDEKIIIGGAFQINGDFGNVARLNSNGSLDHNFNFKENFNHIVKSLVIQRDGKIIVGGFFTSHNGITRNRIARLNEDGFLDDSFDPGSGFDDRVWVTLLQKDGNILVGGVFKSFNNTGRNRIARLFGDYSQDYYPHYAKGFLYDDNNINCNKENEEIGLLFPLHTEPYHSYSFPDSTGHYSLGLNDSVNYKIKPVIPHRFSHYVSNLCPEEYNIYLDSTHPQDTSGFDFGFEYNPCHQLRVDVSSNRRRRCFQNITTVYYTNEGVIAANDVKLHLKMPEYVIPLSASLPYTWGSEGTMNFDIGTLNPNQDGRITIIDSVACVPGITGLTQCTKAWITPENSCQIAATTGNDWDKSSVRVEGACVNDTVKFVIFNTGSAGEGNMAAPSEYRIYADNALIETGTFQLAGGDSIVITFVSGGSTIRLEADQRAGHPGKSKPRASVEACGSDEFGSSSRMMIIPPPQDDEDIHVEIDCLPIIDSYDPNDKQVNPAGVGPQNIVAPGTLLDFTLRFQNTGTDTAYKVVVVDTLSQHLDLASLELGTSSFPYSFKLSGAGDHPVMTFTFDGINLPDTFTNEPKSHGFVKFKIAPKSTVSLGTIVENFVDIFFDYNDPIRTNTTQVTFDLLPYTAADLVKIIEQPEVNQYYCEGESITIAPVFEGNNLKYRWYKGNEILEGESENKLSINSLSLQDTDHYYCQAIGALNFKNSQPVYVNVKQHSVYLLNEFSCKKYTLNDSTYTQSGSYTQILTNAAGCDSILNLNLTIHSVDTSVTLNSTTLTANLSDAIYQWLDCNTGLPFENETNQSFTATENGSYAVIITDNNCTDTSACYEINAIGIDESALNKLKFYPNPTKNSLFINFPESVGKVKIEVIDVMGRLMLIEEFFESSFEIDMNPYTPGTYFIRFMNQQNIVVRKVIKE